MKEQIENSKAFQVLDSISRTMVNKRKFRVQIEDAVVQARTMGARAWKKQSPLMEKYKNIVVELA